VAFKIEEEASGRHVGAVCGREGRSGTGSRMKARRTGPFGTENGLGPFGPCGTSVAPGWETSDEALDVSVTTEYDFF
jgi:hypothetical protein